ncbi:MAG: T9SS type A sorting domain-containing protein [Sphingobacteriales bacterium]|nr:MAG: T9SS type A sorting domain-containing protein [Sphingobacteriales bacterium]
MKRFTMQGDSLGQQVYGGSAVDVPVAILPSEAGGLLLLGSTLSNNGDVRGNHGSRDVWLVRLKAPPDTTPENPVTDTSIYLYPNPVSTEWLYVVGLPEDSSADNNKIRTSTRVYDLMGRSVNAAAQAWGSQRRLNMASLPKGIYIVQIETSRGMIRKKVLVSK